MFKLMGKKIMTIISYKFCLTGPMQLYLQTKLMTCYIYSLSVGVYPLYDTADRNVCFEEKVIKPSLS